MIGSTDGTGAQVLDDQKLLSICVITSESDWQEKSEVFLKYLPKSEHIELVVLLNKSGDEETLTKTDDNIYEYVYMGELDYARLRNIAKELATGSWILSIDMDEVIPEIYHNSLLKLLSDKRRSLVKGFRVAIASAGYDMSIDQPIMENIEAVRIFKNESYINWFGCVHEMVDFSIPPKFIDKTSIQFVHLGYNLDSTDLVAKFKLRYKQLLTLLLNLKETEDLYSVKFDHYSSYLKSVIDHLSINNNLKS